MDTIEGRPTLERSLPSMTELRFREIAALRELDLVDRLRNVVQHRDQFTEADLAQEATVKPRRKARAAP
jgi:hypothetical protein